MKPFIQTSGVSVLLLALAGCADFQLPQLPQLPTLPAANGSRTIAKELPLIKDNLNTVCSTAVDNELRAQEMYKGKRLATAASFDSLEDQSDSYVIRFIDQWKPQHIILIAGRTKDKGNKQALLSLSKKKNYNIVGTVKFVSPSFGDCIISLDDIEFPR